MRRDGFSLAVVLSPRTRLGRKPRGELRISLSAVLSSLVLVTASPLWAADEPKAREIMVRVDERDDGDNQTSNLQMVLIDKRGRQRVRELRSFSKDVGEDTY